MTKITLKYGFIYALASLLWISIEYFMGFQTSYTELQQFFTSLFLIPSIYIIYSGIKAQRDKYHQIQLSFSYFAAFISGFYITIIATLLSPLVIYIFHTFINPDFFESMIRESVSSMEMTENMAREYFNITSYVQQGIVGGLITGSIISTVLALFLKDKK